MEEEEEVKKYKKLEEDEIEKLAIMLGIKKEGKEERS
jgi:hypothetical protein